ncbi:MAG: hypothetical protein EOO70_02335 [Myxococcaceae bacterium]|nr:MAG: hypothetical protein EOO70_02335 [Myxococcaceae bacterium]
MVRNDSKDDWIALSESAMATISDDGVFDASLAGVGGVDFPLVVAISSLDINEIKRMSQRVMSTNITPVVPSAPGRGGRTLGRFGTPLVGVFTALVITLTGLVITACQFHTRNNEAEADLQSLRALRPKPFSPEKIVQEADQVRPDPVPQDVRN